MECTLNNLGSTGFQGVDTICRGDPCGRPRLGRHKASPYIYRYPMKSQRPIIPSTLPLTPSLWEGELLPQTGTREPNANVRHATGKRQPGYGQSHPPQPIPWTNPGNRLRNQAVFCFRDERPYQLQTACHETFNLLLCRGEFGGQAAKLPVNQ